MSGRLARPILIMVLAIAIASTSLAQSVCLPLPRLLTTMPMGGQAGTEFEVVVSGDYIDGNSALHFSHPGLTATQQVNAEGKPEPNKYVVRIAEDCPPGIYEARLMTRLGISSARAFSVDRLAEVVQVSPNTTLETAMPLAVDSICNAVMPAKAVAHFSFDATQGQRYIVHCASRGIDSKLDAVLIIADDAGRDLLVERRGGTLDFTADRDGKYVLKVHELTFKGGPEYFYRLSLQSLPTEADVPQFASTRTVSAFSWPPEGLPETAALQEQEPNNGGTQVQRIELPCDLTGSFYPAADVDVFEFTASKGEVWWIEVASERLGLPTNAAVLVQHVVGEGDEQQITDVAEFTEIPAPIKPSSNAYTYDGPPYDGGSLDVLGKLEIKQDGLYRLQISDLFGGARNDARNVYRLVVRKAAPDFALAAWGLHMELRNGDRNALSKPIALRGGTTMALEVVALRRDGFDGDIELVMEGLPDGVTAKGLKIPAGKSRGIMLITADQDAPPALADVSFYGRAQVGGTELIRPCQMAAMAWPVPDAWSEIPRPRLVSGVPVSVTQSELAPITIAPAEQKVWEAKVGEKLTIPLVHRPRSEFSGATVRLRAFGNGFEAVPGFDASLTAPNSEVTLDLAALKTPPGEYLIAFYGAAVAKYRYNEEGVILAEEAHRQIEAEVAAANAEVKRLKEQVQVASESSKAQAEQALAAAVARQQSTAAALQAAAEKLKQATAQAAPKDTVDILVSEPISIRVKPVEAP